jgi:hypothetical protein
MIPEADEREAPKVADPDFVEVPVILIGVLRGFVQFLQMNTELVLQNRPCLFPATSTPVNCS